MTDPAGLYIHVPFCSRICPYCDFAVRTGKDAEREAYVAGLLCEIEMAAGSRFADGAQFDTIYLGGGTPSALAPAQLETILAAARDRLPIRDDAWITIEANPEDVSAASATVWRDLGVRSLSLGTQSLVDAQLEYLGRSHTGAQAATAVSHARAAGFDIVSLDLIFGLEAQTPDYWRDEIRAVTQLQPEHVSCYQLTFHEGTPFARWLEQGRRSALPEEEQAELYLLLVDELAAAGYSAYEVSNFARRPEFESRHNSKYWGHIPYLGLGPSAHSFDGDRRRWWNARNLPDYLKALDAGARPIADQEVLADHELVTEAVMLGLRTRAGLDLQRVSRRWNVDLAAHNASRFARWREDGLVVGDEVLRPTARGMAIADRLAADVRVGPTRSQ